MRKYHVKQLGPTLSAYLLFGQASVENSTDISAIFDSYAIWHRAFTRITPRDKQSLFGDCDPRLNDSLEGKSMINTDYDFQGKSLKINTFD